MMHEETTAGTEQLRLASSWLGINLSLAPENVTTVTADHESQQSVYAKVFASHYNDLVGMGAPHALESLYDGVDPRGNGSFLAGLLRTFECKTLIDTCSGCQYDILYLLGAASRGEIQLTQCVSNELDNALLDQGMKNLDEVRKTRSFALTDIKRVPWQQLSAEYAERAFDAGICIGNSLSHISDPLQRQLCIQNFAAISKRLFIVDTRNFHQMIANQDILRKQARDFLSTGQTADVGNRVLFPGSIANFPVFISKDRVIMAYVRRGESLPYALVEFSPLLLPVLLAECGFYFSQVDVLCDRSRSGELDLARLEAIDGPRTLQLICSK